MSLPKIIYNLDLIPPALVEREVAARVETIRARLANRGRVLLRLADRLNTIYWIFSLLQEERAFSVVPLRASAEEMELYREATGAAYLIGEESRVQDFAAYTPLPTNDFDIVVFTSGSSATPKAVSLTLAALEHSARCHERWFQLSKEDAWYLCLPLEHMGGLAVVLRSYFLGTPLGVGNAADSSALVEALGSGIFSGTSMVPTQVVGLLNEINVREHGLRRLRYILLGGAAVDPFLLKQILSSGSALPIYPSYGMSETASQIATARLGESLEERLEKKYLVGSVEAKRNAQGELLVRGISLFRGYLRQGVPESEKQAWFNTGDLAEFLAPDCLRIVGRSKEIIVSGGVNISLAEIRRVAAKHPSLSNFEAIGLEDDYWGQRLLGFYTTHSGEALPTKDLHDFFAGSLEPAKIPKHFFHLASFSLLPSGKLDQCALHALAKERLQP